MVSSIVAVHGIGQFQSVPPHIAEHDLTLTLRSAIADGIEKHRPAYGLVDLRGVYYAHLLRREGEQGDGDELSEQEQAFLGAWMAEYGVPVEPSQTWAGVPVRLVADWLAKSLNRSDDGSFVRRIAEFLTNLARDASRYLHELEMRAAVRSLVTATIKQRRPDVVIGHSLGSVVAYEVLWENPDLPVDTLVTVGSPLALPGAVFDHLQPAPSPDARSGLGRKPPQVRRWINVADHSDLIAIPRPLSSRFEGLDRADDLATDIGTLAVHSFSAYLRDRMTVGALP